MIQSYKIITHNPSSAAEWTEKVRVTGLPANCRNTYSIRARAVKKDGVIPFREEPRKFIGVNLNRLNGCLSLRNNRTGKVVRAEQARNAAPEIAFRVAHKARIDEKRAARYAAIAKKRKV